MSDEYLKSKIVSLELAERMKKLGWKRKTHFVWVKMLAFPNSYRVGDVSEYSNYKDIGTDDYLAPLFCEIWEELPIKIEYKGKDKHRSLEKELYTKYMDNDNYIDYESIMYECIWCDTINEINEKPIQENAGELWCWLKENGYIKER